MSEGKIGCVVLLALFGGAAAFQGCRAAQFTDEDAVRSLETQGYSDVRVVSREPWWPQVLGGCGESDAVAVRARAKNAAGREVEVTVCGSWPFKGATVRTR